MKIKCIFCIFCISSITYAQKFEMGVFGYNYFSFKGNKIYFYTEKKNGKLLPAKFFVGIRDGSLEKGKYRDKQNIISKDSLIPIKNVDANFDIIKEFKNKIYAIQSPNAMFFYFVKNEKNKSFYKQRFYKQNYTWKSLQQTAQILYQIHVVKNKTIYMFVQAGIIFKKDGVVEGIFNNLEHNENITTQFLNDKDSVTKWISYLDFGQYKINVKNTKTENETPKYIAQAISKNGKVILDNLVYTYFNNKRLLEINQDSIILYDTNLQKISYPVRDMIEGDDDITFLSGNKILKQSLKDFKNMPNQSLQFLCGTVVGYALKIDKKKIIKETHAERVGGNNSQNSINIVSSAQFDSLLFFNKTHNFEWDDNHDLSKSTFDTRILLFKNGKQGLYEFELKDSTMTLKEILPIQFDKIYELNNHIILKRGNEQDILSYYLQNKKMRFTKINAEENIPYYLRYEKLNHQKGWMNPQGVLFDDLP